MIKNIIFDFGNVLVGWNEEKIVEKFSGKKEEQELLKKIIFKSDEWFMLDEGLLNYDDAIKIFKEKLPSNLKLKVDNIMQTWYTYMPINNQITNLIKDLKQKGYKIYGLSNTHIPVYEYIKNSDIGKYFDGFVISAIEKMMKPNKEIYFRLFEKFNLIPKECYFIDDSEKNINVAIDCGMNGYVSDAKKFDGLTDNLIKNEII